MAWREGRVNGTVNGHIFYIFGWRRKDLGFVYVDKKEEREGNEG